MLKPVLTDRCPHDRRPSTSVCLYCLQDARNAARQRRKRVMARVGMATLGGGVVLALAVGAFIALVPDGRSRSRSVDDQVTRAVESTAGPVVSQSSGEAHTPAIAEGRRELGDGIISERQGDTVTVSFDTDMLRTRFDWKFEGVVRGTLPLMFGDLARIALDSIPHGELLRGADLIEKLPRAGFAIPLPAEAGSIRVWPVVRGGRDGPLVYAYRAVRDSV